MKAMKFTPTPVPVPEPTIQVTMTLSEAEQVINTLGPLSICYALYSAIHQAVRGK